MLSDRGEMGGEGKPLSEGACCCIVPDLRMKTMKRTEERSLRQLSCISGESDVNCPHFLKERLT